VNRRKQYTTAAFLWGGFAVAAFAGSTAVAGHGGPAGAWIIFAVAVFAMAVSGWLLAGRDDRLPARPAARPREEIIARWQKRRDRLAAEARWRISWRWDITTAEAQRLIRETWQGRYEAEAGDARARGEWVPTLEQLRTPAAGDNPWPLTGGRD
jgi:hypothetical protein